MPDANLELVIDGDGHLVEDMDAIGEFMPEDLIPRDLVARQARGWNNSLGIFPAADHLHAAQPVRHPKGSFVQADADGWMAFLDDVGIDTTVLFATRALTSGMITNREWAIAATRGYNDWLHQTYLLRSPRFKGLGIIPMQEPAAAVEELRRIVTGLGFLGAILPSPNLGRHHGAKEYWPVYEEADRLGCVMAVHAGGHSGLGFDTFEYLASAHALGHPVTLMTSFASIVFNGVMDKYPNVRFGWMEGGIGWFLMCLERFNRSYETHQFVDPRGELMQLRDGERVSDYVARHIGEGRLFVGCEGHEALLAEAIAQVGSNGFPVYSSDFPHEVNSEMCKAEIREVIEHPRLLDEDKAAILHGNAQRMYKLTPVG